MISSLKTGGTFPAELQFHPEEAFHKLPLDYAEDNY